MGWLGKRPTDEQRAEDLFSPYLDGQVTAEERRFLEQYLAAHAEAREKLALLRSAVQLTKTLPSVSAPRSFVLPASMARKPGRAMRLYPAMRLATVAAVALFAFALVGDLATSARLAPSASQPAADTVLSSAPAELPPTQAPLPTEAPLRAVPVPTPTGSPESAPSEAATGAAAEATPAPTPAAAAALASTETPAAGMDGFFVQQQAPTAEATAQGSRDRSAAVAEVSQSKSAVAPTNDLLRIAVFIFGGLALGLTVVTLIMRRAR